ncbi:hypothetical protein HAX54_005131, partial [Datura stramonium]|nr:hypothetical protein [Datura stramonium]
MVMKHNMELRERVAYSAGANISPHVAYSVGANFTPHVITVNAGEVFTFLNYASAEVIGMLLFYETGVQLADISICAKVYNYHFSVRGSRAVCVLAANGAISNVTLGQPNSSGGTLTYEGRFEILSLTGSYISSDNGLTKSRSGGACVSGPDGRSYWRWTCRHVGGSWSCSGCRWCFIPGHQQEQNLKKQSFEHAATLAAIPATQIYEERTDGAYTRPNSNFTSPTPFPGDNTISLNSIHSSRISEMWKFLMKLENIISLLVLVFVPQLIMPTYMNMKKQLTISKSSERLKRATREANHELLRATCAYSFATEFFLSILLGFVFENLQTTLIYAFSQNMYE